MKILDASMKKVALPFCIFLFLICTAPILAEQSEKLLTTVNLEEGGHLETDFNTNFMAEWWYLNGNVILMDDDGKKKDLGFFTVVAHQESPMIRLEEVQLSHLLTFYGLYSDEGTVFNYTETFLPQVQVGEYIALGTPYVDFTYPDGSKRLYGSAISGFNLNYRMDEMEMDLVFMPETEMTVDQATVPLNFTTYEHSFGTISGSMTLNGKRYRIINGEGYMDHMIPISDVVWPVDMHGWTWFETTTKNYQTVAYAVRSPEDGYDGYSYMHLTLLDRRSGRVIGEYGPDEITIIESCWISEPDLNRRRPTRIDITAPDLRISLQPEMVVNFDRSSPDYTGFVDFMSYQPKDAKIEYRGKTYEGTAFYEYLVSDVGTII